MWGMYGGHGPPLPMMGNDALMKELESLDPLLYMEPITAHRAWHAILHPKRGIFLRSITHKIGWPPRKPMIAHCLTQLRGDRIYSATTSAHTCPNLKHQCGIYAVKEADAARRWAGYSDTLGAQVTGGVLLWGQVMQFTKGFISEYAYPRGLTLNAETCKFASPEEVRDELKERYGVNVQLGEWST